MPAASMRLELAPVGQTRCAMDEGRDVQQLLMTGGCEKERGKRLAEVDDSADAGGYCKPRKEVGSALLEQLWIGCARAAEAELRERKHIQLVLPDAAARRRAP
mmetsp:Transcript_5122/g.13763  ORF Transcript_5122/g.13763 Transcript_5122/m.13763 type:complete len:103 (-) Transcript_5122:652-960(-)|eukprot:CAMPEP_0185840654 /NCGR_PEP_ID=MMETSP1353-20130828/16596_1 /TAXON_ID=1077150 /ORGANISM="Erythrolobus australicus, Strain CCMP3124" /LENGTH=102 /DNA_ID=CAMNT_0028540011 /DNA_START=679 /DNA_END=987 /DNA_ORIENTATION=+